MAVFLLLWVERFGEEPKARMLLQHDARLLFSARPRRGGHRKRTRIISISAATATKIFNPRASRKQRSNRSVPEASAAGHWHSRPFKSGISDVQSDKYYLQSHC